MCKSDESHHGVSVYMILIYWIIFLSVYIESPVDYGINYVDSRFGVFILRAV